MFRTEQHLAGAALWFCLGYPVMLMPLPASVAFRKAAEKKRIQIIHF
jgi:hypothetical protein